MRAGTQWIAVGLVVLATATVAGQRAGGTAADESAPGDPLRCWWRASTGAVRIGEVFSVVLTCALEETPDVTVVAQTEGLDPSAIRLQPLEITGGARRQDLRTPTHRFLQYEYRARVFSDTQFGKDVSLPELKIAYSVRRRVEGNPVPLEGREQTYLLSPLTLRVLSLVPATATDIRDATQRTFDAIERERSVAGVWRIASVVLLAFAALPAVFAVVRLRERRRAGRATQTHQVHIDDAAILRHAGRELAAIARARAAGGWTDDLAQRLTTTLRILGAYVLGLPVRQRAAPPATEPTAGHLTVRRGWRRPPVLVPAWVTPGRVAEARAHRAASGAGPVDELDALETLLTRVTEARYSRAPDAADAVFEETLTFARRVVKGLKVDHLWLVQKGRAAARLIARGGGRA